MSDLTYISSTHGDWCGIYIDNKLLIEGHSIPVHDWLDIVETQTIYKTQQLEICGEWLEEGGSFPQSFSDIPSEKLS